MYRSVTGHAAVSAQAGVEFTVDQRSVKQPLAKQIEHAVDLRPGRGRKRPRLGARLVWAGERGSG